MEKETKMLLWGLFSVAVMATAIIPVGWNTSQHMVDQGVVENANMAQALWGQTPPISASVEVNTQYPQATNVAIIPGALHPHISSVEWEPSSFPPKMTILGSGFGNPPATGQVVLTYGDQSRGWSGANANSAVAAHIATWANSQIVVDGFVPSYGAGDSSSFADGLGSWVFARNDQILLQVTNPQTGYSGTFTTPFPANATMPAVTVTTSAPTVVVGQSLTLSGSVTWNGQPLGDQAVNLSATAGSFAASGGTQVTPNDFMVFTDAQGHYSVTYTAPSVESTVQISAMADSITATTGVTVLVPPQITGVTWNTGTWPPQPTITGNHFGTASSNEYVQIGDQPRVWQGGTSNSAVIFIVGNWNDSQVTVTSMNNYGEGGGDWIFAPGDSLYAHVTNPQTGLDVYYNMTYPANASMPTVTLGQPSTLAAGQSETLSGNVSFEGTGLANQTVTLNGTGGNITSGSSVLTGQTVQTDSNGNFMVTYTAPAQPDTYAVSASSDTEYATQQIQVIAPNIGWYGMPIVAEGQSTLISGQVTGVGGTPLVNQTVVLSANAGNVNPTTVTTDANGNFSTRYTASTMAATVTVMATCDTASGLQNVTVFDPTPQIAGVTWNTSTWPPSLSVKGSGFGRSGILEVIEDAQGQGAVWDNNPDTPDDKLQVSSWNDTWISIGNFAQYGAANGFYFAPGEAVGVIVTNGQTGQSAPYYTATYPANAPMPTVTLDPVATLNTGQSTTVTGSVTFNGSWLANQQVNLAVSGGTLSSSTVWTASNGYFSTTYTAPAQPGTYTVSASSDGSSASTNVSVSSPISISVSMLNSTNVLVTAGVDSYTLNTYYQPIEIKETLYSIATGQQIGSPNYYYGNYGENSFSITFYRPGVYAQYQAFCQGYSTNIVTVYY